MTIKADINKVTLSDWLLLSGEFKARTATAELSDELLACDVCLLQITLQDGSVIDSPIEDGAVEIPCVLKSQQIIIGVVAYNSDDDGNLEKRYSPEPCYYYVPRGSFKEAGKEQGYLSLGAYGEVLKKLAEVNNLKNEVDNLNTDVDGVEKNVAALSEDIEGVKTDVDTLNKGGLIMKEDFIGELVKAYLDSHPEATTSVQDGSLEIVKMTDTARAWIRSNVINVKDYGFVDDGVTDNRGCVGSLISAIPDDGGYVRFPKGHYVFGLTANRQSVFDLKNKKNLTVDLDGSTLEVLTNGYPQYNFFSLTDCENFKIINGTLKGDRYTHDYTTTSGTHEFGYGISAGSSLTHYDSADAPQGDPGTPSDTLKCCGLIENVELYDFTGDGIVTKNGMSPGTITIKDCLIHHCRRQGISILDSDTVEIIDCYIHHIGDYDGITGASPRTGIDIEPGSGTLNVNYVLIKGTKIEETTSFSIVGVSKTKSVTESDVTKKYAVTTVQAVDILDCDIQTPDLLLRKSFEDYDLVCPVNVERTKITYRTLNIGTTNQPILLCNATLKRCHITVQDFESDNASRDLFTSDRKMVIIDSIVDVPSLLKIRYATFRNCVIKGGVLIVHDGVEDASIGDCVMCEFEGTSFSLVNMQGKQKFVLCSFENCTSWTTSAPKMRFRNCYMDTKVIAGADYQNCTIEDELV